MRSMARLVSRLLVAASIPLGFAVPFLAWLGRVEWHTSLVGYVALPVFVTGVSAAYVASGLRRAPWWLDRLVGLLALAVGAAALLAPRSSLPLIVASLAYGGVVLWASTLASGSVALSLGGLGASYLVLGLYLLLPGPGDWLLRVVGAVYASAVGPIYAVTVHSFPRTYGMEPRRCCAYLLYLAHAAGVLLLAAGLVKASAALLTAAMLILYPLAARLDSMPGVYRGLRSRLATGRSVALRSHLYFLAGHFLVPLMALYVAAGWLLLLHGGGVLLLAHAVAAGFTLLHIEIHAPMMLPVILGLRHARRYWLLNYILLAPVPLLVPMGGPWGLLGLVLAASSMAATLLVAWPTARRKR